MCKPEWVAKKFTHLEEGKQIIIRRSLNQTKQEHMFPHIQNLIIYMGSTYYEWAQIESMPMSSQKNNKKFHRPFTWPTKQEDGTLTIGMWL